MEFSEGYGHSQQKHFFFCSFVVFDENNYSCRRICDAALVLTEKPQNHCFVLVENRSFRFLSNHFPRNSRHCFDECRFCVRFRAVENIISTTRHHCFFGGFSWRAKNRSACSCCTGHFFFFYSRRCSRSRWGQSLLFPYGDVLARADQHPLLAAYDIGTKEEAKKFGVLVPKNESVVAKFQEKPENPESTLVSLGCLFFQNIFSQKFFSFPNRITTI